jgi:probable addiction module antidote protein
MAIVQTRAWDAADHLETKEDIAAYLEAALEEGDPSLVVAALGDIARSKGMTQIARETGLGREISTKRCRLKVIQSLLQSSKW